MWKQLLLGISVAGACAGAWAQTYPDKPIRLVVPFPPGGGVDLAARTLGAELQEILKTPVIIENRAGASGTIGTAHVARAAADGHTLLVGSPGSTTIAAATGRKTGYDVTKDFAPIALAGWPVTILVVPDASPYKQVADLVAAAKAAPDKLTYGSSGAGNSQHLAGEMFNQAAGLRTLHVPYQGTGPALTGLIGGQVDFFFCDPACLPLIQSGKLRALAVTSTSRQSVLPALPTIAEAVPGFSFQNWYGFMAPAKTPTAVIERLHDAVVRAQQTEAVKDKFAKAGLAIAALKPAEFGQFVADDQRRWEQVIRVGGIKID